MRRGIETADSKWPEELLIAITKQAVEDWRCLILYDKLGMPNYEKACKAAEFIGIGNFRKNEYATGPTPPYVNFEELREFFEDDLPVVITCLGGTEESAKAMYDKLLDERRKATTLQKTLRQELLTAPLRTRLK